MNTLPTDLWLNRMFRARTVVLVTGAVFVGLEAFPSLADRRYGVLPGLEEAWAIVAALALFVVLAGSAGVWYCMFRVGLNVAGPAYAIGHMLLCMVLTPVCLVGIVLIPLQVCNDIERWERFSERAAVSESVDS
jgi:hypothetical protein